MRMIPEKCVEHPWIKDNLKLGISNRKLDKRRLSNYVVKNRWNKALHSIHAVVRMGLAGLKVKNLVKTKTSNDLFNNIQEVKPESELKSSINMTGLNTVLEQTESTYKEPTNLDVVFKNNQDKEDASSLRFNTKQFNQKENADGIKDGKYDTTRYSSPVTKEFLSSVGNDTFKRSMASTNFRHVNELEDKMSSSQKINMFSTRGRSSIIDNLLAGYASKERPLYTKNWNLEKNLKQRPALPNTVETPKFLTKEGRPINSGAVLRIANLFSSNHFS